MAEPTSDERRATPVVKFKKRGKLKRKRGSALAQLAAADDARDAAVVQRPERARSGGVTHAQQRSSATAAQREPAAFVGAEQRSAAENATLLNALEESPAEKRAREEREAELRDVTAEAGAMGDGVYRGQAAYRQWQPDGDRDRPKASRVGPQRGSAFARVTTVFDYAMPICKDYKDTGVCGYGDNCIYLHDRTDYKAGWEMERDFDEALKKKREGGGGDDDAAGGNAADDDKGEYYIGSDDDASEDSDGFPTKCGICKKRLRKPVKTRCEHYFCHKCAKKRLVKGKTDCATCGAATDGLLNAVPKLEAKLEAKKDD